MPKEKRGNPIQETILGICQESDSLFIKKETNRDKAKPSVLLHSCCGPCSTAVVERLAEDYEVTIYFYNPNITDKEEYDRRKKSQEAFVMKINEDISFPYKIGFKEGSYDVELFLKSAEGLEEEKEGGKRCEHCFRLRLEKTAQMAGLLQYDLFATTLTVSPHKDYDAIASIGRRLAIIYDVGFLNMDFKKKAGFQRSIELSKKYGLYRQSYCGCDYSKRPGK